MMQQVFISLIISIIVTTATTAAPPILTREQAAADVYTAVCFIRTVHPSPFTIVPERKFDRAIERLKKQLPDNVSRLDLYTKFAPIVASLGDGHTFLDLRKSGLERYFPLPVEVDPYTLTMTSGGRRVVAINGVKARKIVDEIVASQSGESVGFRVVRAAGIGWPILISWFHPAEEYAVQFTDNQAIVDAVEYEKLVLSRRENLPNYSFRIEDNVAILEFNSCMEPEKFKPFLAEMFTEIRNKNIDNLAIDLRANGGGTTRNANELFQYISPVPFCQDGKIVKRISEPLRRDMRGIDENWARKIVAMPDTTIVYPESPDDLIPLRENPLRFTGKRYLLTSLNTFSSAMNLAGAFKYFKMGTVVGSETGGWQVSFGELLSLQLPNSQLGIGVSDLLSYNYGCTDADRGPVRPDIAVPPAEALDYVLKLIATRQNND